MAQTDTPQIVVSIEAKQQLGDRAWRVCGSTRDGHSAGFKYCEFEIREPLRSIVQDGQFRWLLEEYANEPFSSPRLKTGRGLFASYRASLQEQLTPLLALVKDTAGPIALQILLSPKEPGIDSIHWEILEGDDSDDETPALAWPSVEVHRVLQVSAQTGHTEQTQSTGTRRILAVEARSYTEPDVQPRLTTLPLVQTIDAARQSGQGDIHLDYIRPGTFEEFTRVLSQRSGAIDLVHFDLHGNSTEHDGATLEFVGIDLKHRQARSAKEVGEALASHGVRWAVLCACRTATSTGLVASNLAAEFLRCGLRGVIAMRYELKSMGARVFAASFYDALCVRGLSFVQSAAEARRAMQKDRKRAAQYQEMVDIPDYIVPAVYTVDGADWGVSSSSLTSISPPLKRSLPQTTRPLLGREAEIRLIEKAFLTDSTFVAVAGGVGAGKSSLLEHLAWWWKATSLFEKVYLLRPDLGTGYGLRQLAETFNAEVLGRNTTVEASCSPVETIRDALYELNGKNAVVLLDGLEALYTPTCSPPDTAQDWQNLLRIIGLLSRNCCAVVVAISDTSWAFPDGATDGVNIIRLSRFGIQDSRRLLAARGIKTDADQSQAEPEMFLANACEALDFNPTAILQHGRRINEPFGGISTLLAWEKDSTVESNLGEKEATKSGSTDPLLVCFDKAGWNLEAVLLQVLGLFTHVIPDIESSQPLLTALSNILVDEARRFRLSPTRYGLEEDTQLRLSFPAWQYFQSPGRSTSDVKIAASRCIDALSTMSLLWKNVVKVSGGKDGHHIHALATLSLRRSFNASFQPGNRAAIREVFKAFYEERAMAMLADKPGMSRYEMPTHVFVRSEKWNLVATIAQPLPVREELTLYFDGFAFVCLAAIKPFATTDTSYSSDFLWYCIVRRYLEELHSVLQEQPGMAKVLEQARILIVINWAVDYVQRRRQKDDEPWLIQLRLSMMDGELAAEPTGKISVSHQQALLSNVTAAIRNGDAAMQRSALQRAKAARDVDPEGWGVNSKMLDYLVSISQLSDLTISNPNASYEELKDPMSKIRELAQVPSALPPSITRAFLTQVNTADQLITTTTSLGPDPLADASQSDLVIHFRTGMIQQKINTLGLARALPETHMKYLRVITKQLGKGDLPMVKKTAEAALRVSRAGEDYFATGKWRAFCDFLGSLDSPFFYEEMQDYLVKWAEERPRNGIARLIKFLAEGDTPRAYTFAKDMGPAFGWIGHQKEADICRKVVPLLEPYKGESLGLGEEWFVLYQGFYRVLKEMAEGEGEGVGTVP
ncbi:hypothetical protein B0T16DRAFT_455910 [Cercophora newfieldiana]|uniref:CHAT domain-containing protein n=1 Tax=Cercophora newfieldiana TaxID=92897 RepID=A0AA39YAL8_9PEZI|nr:hypothetical protein B0T16DRAFT_455910 [Cercophora newfieldiana]